MMGAGNTGGGGGGTSRKHYWGGLIILALCCSGLYVLLYYRASLTTPSALIFPRNSHTPSPETISTTTTHSLRTLTHSSYNIPVNSSSSLALKPGRAVQSLEVKNYSSPLRSVVSSKDHVETTASLDINQSQSKILKLADKIRNTKSDQTVQNPGGNNVDKETHSRHADNAKNAKNNNTTNLENEHRMNSQPLLTLFTTWSDREDLSLVRKLTLRNWAQLKPDVQPVLFTNDSKMATLALHHGWETLPISKMAIGVPVLKYMYLDAMKKFPSRLFAFANGDILFTKALVDTLQAILKDQSLPLNDQPVFVVGQRTNVARVTEKEASSFKLISQTAKQRGRLFTTMAEDFFITDKRFPWDDIPGVVVGRVAYDNWLVLHAIQSHYVVVDITKTAIAVHQTTKAGNHEGSTHANSAYNDNMLQRLYKRIQYMAGCVDCAPWYTERDWDGVISVEKREKRPKHC